MDVTNGLSVETVAVETAGEPTLSGESEHAKVLRRAVRSLLGVGQRMAWLMNSDTPIEKMRAELGGMSAWVEAFTLQLAGLPIELTKAPQGEYLLANVSVETGAAGVSARVALESEGLSGTSPPVPTRQAALAVALVTLALRTLERIDTDVAAAVTPERDFTRGAEIALLRRLSEALCFYHEADLVPEINAHGMPEDG